MSLQQFFLFMVQRAKLEENNVCDDALTDNVSKKTKRGLFLLVPISIIGTLSHNHTIPSSSDFLNFSHDFCTISLQKYCLVLRDAFI